ncbi:MAG: DUF4258 domain-containing protein [Candidatus Brocadiaceae bacterium]|nr:DUF4258 domain-containing protein [Candidatus Brocadiaceae bacterium]
MKSIRLTKHAQEQCIERGATEEEVRYAILHGHREICRYSFPYNTNWQGKHYAVKQVAPVIKEEQNEIVVIIVYTMYF